MNDCGDDESAIALDVAEQLMMPRVRGPFEPHELVVFLENQCSDPATYSFTVPLRSLIDKFVDDFAGPGGFAWEKSPTELSPVLAQLEAMALKLAAAAATVRTIQIRVCDS